MGAVGIKNIFNYLWKKKFCLFRKKKVFSITRHITIFYFSDQDYINHAAPRLGLRNETF